MTTPTAPVPVHVPERSRFEVAETEGTAVLVYSLRGSDSTSRAGSSRRAVVLEHTVVPEQLEGRGVGTALARSALAWAAQQSLPVVPQCAFVQEFLRRHPGEVRVEVLPA